MPLYLWLQVIHLICASKKGIATRQIQRMLNCSMKTAWFLGASYPRSHDPDIAAYSDRLGGAGMTVEVDETYMGRKARRDQALSCAPADKMPVFASGRAPRPSALRSMSPTVTANGLRRHHGAQHQARKRPHERRACDLHYILAITSPRTAPLSIPKKEYARGDVTPTPLEGFFSILKRGVIWRLSARLDSKHLATAISPNLISDITTGPSLALMICAAPNCAQRRQGQAAHLSNNSPPSRRKASRYSLNCL